MKVRQVMPAGSVLKSGEAQQIVGIKNPTRWGMKAALMLGAATAALLSGGCASLANWRDVASSVVCDPPGRVTVVPLGGLEKPAVDASLIVSCRE